MVLSFRFCLHTLDTCAKRPVFQNHAPEQEAKPTDRETLSEMPDALVDSNSIGAFAVAVVTRLRLSAELDNNFKSMTIRKRSAKRLRIGHPRSVFCGCRPLA